MGAQYYIFSRIAEGEIMGKKEEPMIAYYEDARHFAWLVNGWICRGDEEINESQIQPKNIRFTGKTGSGRTVIMRSRYRDVFKEIGKVKVVLMIGTELQSFVDYSMPVRIMDYDALEYKDQIQKITSERKVENAAKSGKQKVVLSPIKKEDRLIPVITLVLYMGEEPWDAAKNLHGLLDFSEVPERFKTYIPDYQIHVLDVCHTPDERLLEFPKDIATMFLTIKYRDNLPTLKKVLKAIPEIENIEEDTYDVMWNFLDKRMLELKENVQNEDGGINMCGAVDQMIAEGMERGMERGLAQGMERGLAQGTERGIKNLIEVCQELGTSYDNVQFQVEMKYNLSQEEAERYMKQYWK